MKININLKNFKKNHLKKVNQVISSVDSFKNEKIIENLIDNFLKEKNSFVFESVEKGKIRGRYTIFGKDPDKIWEFNKNKIYLFKNDRKKLINSLPYPFLKKLIENFNFPLPKNLPPICSLLVGFFSYEHSITFKKISKLFLAK